VYNPQVFHKCGSTGFEDRSKRLCYCQGAAQAFSGDYTIENVKSGKVINVAGNSLANGGHIHQWDNPEEKSSQWSITQADGAYVLTNVNSGKALNVAANSLANGANIQQWNNPGETGSQWFITHAEGIETPDDAYVLTNVNSGKAINVAGNSLANGGNIQQWNNPGETSSQWYLHPLSS
jgi:hypothetical protein